MERFSIRKEFFAECKTYFLNLKVRVKKTKKNETLVEEKLILKTGKKTGLVGLITAMTSIENIMEDVLSSPSCSMKLLATFKLSQDILEIFFGVVRSRFGFNNNPNAFQLMYGLKGILSMKTESITTGNCMDLN